MSAPYSSRSRFSSPLAIPPETLRKYATWFTIYGVLIALAGIAAILLPGVATLATTILVGWLLVASGVIGLFAVFSSGREAPGFWWNLFVALLYLVAGALLLARPLSGILTLTLILAAYFLASGVSKAVVAFEYKSAIPKAWLWMLLSALVDVVLGVMIILGLPNSAVWVIGLLVGINLLFTGITIVISALYGKQLAEEVDRTPHAPSPAGGV